MGEHTKDAREFGSSTMIDQNTTESFMNPSFRPDYIEDEATNRQVGGSHYKNFKIQPVEYIEKNGFGFLQGCITKRIARYNIPGGKGLEDLEKAKHEIDLLIQLEGLTEGP
jgi:hypothetical protein